MKTAMKKLFSLVLVAVLLVGVMPFQAFATDSISVPVEIYVNGSYKRTANLSVSADMTLDEDLALSMLEVPDNRSLDKWVSSTGKEFKSASLEYSWLAEHVQENTYSLKMYLNESIPDPEPKPDPEPDPEPEPEPDPTYNVTLKAYHGETLLDSVTCSDLTAGSTINVSEKISVDGYYIDSVEGGSFTITVAADATYRVEMLPNPVEEPAKAMYSVTFNLSKDGNSRTFSRTFEEGTVLTLNEELIGEVNIRKATVEWIVNGSHKKTDNTVIVNGPMTISCSITNKESEKETIDLDTEGGRLPSYVSDEYTVVIGQPYGNLPEPTREGYTFAYWYYEDDDDNEVRVYNTTIVKADEDLHAKWIANGITVTFQRYDMLEGWVNVEKHTVPVNSVLTVEDGTFPSDSRIDLVYDIPDFEIVGWEIGDTDKKFEEDDTEVTSNITIRPRYRGKVRLVALEPVSNASWKSFYETLEIGEVIGDLENPGSRSTFAFAGWVASNGTDMICDEYCDSKLEYYPHLYGTTFYSVWAGGTTVRLHIHTNGNTSSASKIVPYYVAPATGKFDLNAIDMYSIYGSYYKYDDDCDEIYGWYDAEEWKNYCANRAAHPATSYMDIVENNRFDFHIMLINNGDDSSYGSSSSSSADSSNPKTGDMIMTPVIVLCASVGALATLFYLNKKRSV